MEWLQGGHRSPFKSRKGAEERCDGGVGQGWGAQMVETGRGLLTLTMEEAGLERGVGQRLEPGDHPPPSAAMDTDLTCVT